MRFARPALAAVVAGLSISAACLPGAMPPVVPARSAFSIDDARAHAAVASGPLQVVFAGPRGDTTAETEIGVVFNKPMRALGLGPSDPPPPITLRPAAKGAFHWVGSRTLRFDTEEPLAPGTAFTVEIPAGTRALDGSTLAEAFAFAFDTPRTAVVESTPEDGARDVEPTSTITLRWSEPVSDAEIARAVTIRGERASAPIPFEIQRGIAKRVELVPKKSLPAGDRIHVHIDASVRGERGDLPAGRDHDIVFSTVMPPSVVKWSCEPHVDDATLCDPDRHNVAVELSGEVPRSALARAITIEPAVDWDRSSDLKDDAPTRELSVWGQWKPGVTYTVRVTPGPKLVDVWGQRLAGDGARTLRFGHYESRVSLGLRGKYWSAKATHAFAAYTQNTSHAEFYLVPRSLDDVLRALGGAKLGAPPKAGIALAERGIDERASTSISVDNDLPGARGPVDLVWMFTPRGSVDRRTLSHEAQITDLGISARVGHGSAAVLVTGLDDGKPASGTSVDLYRVPEKGAAERLDTAMAGTLGDAALRFDHEIAKTDKLAVVARNGSDWTYRVVEAPRAPEIIGSVWSERGIYRPGETVKMSGVIRTPWATGLRVPSDKHAHVVVRTYGEAPILEQDITLSSFGTFAIDVPIPKTGRLDGYRVEVKTALGSVHGSFFVAEYRPTEIAVTAATDRPSYKRGETMRCNLRGTYLHGGPMAGASASIVATRGHAWFEIPGHAQFSIRDFEHASNTSEVANLRKKLDERGDLSAGIPLTLPGQTGPEQVRCSAEVMDLNRQSLAAEAHAIVHPADVYVAIERNERTSIEPGGAWKIRLVTPTPHGERKAARVHVEAAWRKRMESKEDHPAGACDVTTGDAVATCTITAPRDAPLGSQLIARASVTDARGNVARATDSVTIEPPPRPTPPAKPEPPEPPRKELRASVARSLVLGQTGRIALESPYKTDATAIVTIEREGILWHHALALPPTGTSVDFAVTDAMIPSAHVTVTAIAGEKVTRAEESFEVDAAPKMLTVDLEIGGGEAHRPGDAIDVNVFVKDAQGHPTRAEVTLWSADEASLSLVYYSVPDVHGRLFSWRRSLISHADSRDDLLHVGLWGSHRTKPPQIRMGATSVSPPRVDFKQTAFFEAHLVTDDHGRLTKRFTLPDGLTTYRVMAVAVTAEDRFGSKQTKVVTSLPLMARATLPRFVRAGDRFEASVVVTADADGEASVSAEATGVTILAPAPKWIGLKRGIPSEVRFPIRTDGAGPARLSFRATQGAHTDAMTLTRDVVPPLVPESSSVDGETDRAAAEGLGDLSSIRSDYGGLEIALSTTPLAGLADGVDQLVEYPYGCTEQTVSRLVPLLALRDLAESLGKSLPAKTDGAVRDAVARLLTHQRRDGGFGLWQESSRSTPWLTGWAMWGLGEARRRGFTVPVAAETRARAYLAEAAAFAPDAAPGKLALAAFAADLAALDGKPDAALTAKLFAVRDRLPPFSRGLLLHAMALGKDARAKDLAAEIQNLVRLDGATARVVSERAIDLYDSDTRTTAMLLRGLVALDPKHPLVPRLARALIESRRGGRFRTTHDAAWALLALDDVRRAAPRSPDETDVRVFLGDALIRESTLRGAIPATFSMPASNLLAAGTRPLAFSTNGPLHYHARLRFARRDLPTEPVESGMFLRRTMRALDGSTPQGPLPAGALMLVEITLATPSPRNAVVIESPLPAGLEAADADLRLGGAWVRALEHSGYATRRELRDDRVIWFVDDLPAGVSTYRFVARASTPGVFLTPPARAEEMYAPDTFARTAVETVTVRAP